MADPNEVQATRDAIAKINARLASGVTSVTTDGTTTSVDLRTLKDERGRLERTLATLVQPISASIDLTGGA